MLYICNVFKRNRINTDIKKIKRGDIIDKKEEKKFVDATISALENIRQSFSLTKEAFDKYDVVKKAVPFLVIGIENVEKILEEYIEIYKRYRKELK